MSHLPCRDHAVLLPTLCALFLMFLPTGSQARPANGPTCASSGCHGNPVLDTTPGDGGTLSFGANGRTLVGQTSTAAFVLRNLNNKPSRGGGFKGEFPGVPSGGEFGPTAPLAIAGDTVSAGGTAAGYLTPQLGSESRNYTYTPTGRGTDTLAVSFTPSLGYIGTPPTVSVTFRGQGVAPVADLDTGASHAGNVRTGTTGTAELTIRNMGDGNQSGLGQASNLHGSFESATGAFTGGATPFSLADGASASMQYVFAPTTRGTQTQNVEVSLQNGSSDGANRASSFSAELTGTGVGPMFVASLDQTGALDFGEISGTTARAMTIVNASLDPDLGDMTALTLLSYEITGLDAVRFSLDAFTPGTVLANGERAELSVIVSPGIARGPLSAILTFRTDEGTALGGNGTPFTYSLSAVAVPEPGIYALMAAGLFCLFTLARRRRVPIPLLRR